jgi:hypothetical protein
MIKTQSRVLLLVSFVIFAEAGKQNATSLSGFVLIQTAFSLKNGGLLCAHGWVGQAHANLRLVIP